MGLGWAQKRAVKLILLLPPCADLQDVIRAAGEVVSSIRRSCVCESLLFSRRSACRIETRHVGSGTDRPPYMSKLSNDLREVGREQPCIQKYNISTMARLLGISEAIPFEAGYHSHAGRRPATTVPRISMLLPGAHYQNYGFSLEVADTSQPGSFNVQDSTWQMWVYRRQESGRRCHQINAAAQRTIRQSQMPCWRTP